MDRHAVLVFRGQDLDDEQQMAFGRAFGPREPTPFTVEADKQRRPQHAAAMNGISALDERGRRLAADARRRLCSTPATGSGTPTATSSGGRRAACRRSAPRPSA